MRTGDGWLSGFTNESLYRERLLQILSTEGRSVCLCWAKSKPKRPKGKGGGGARTAAGLAVHFVAPVVRGQNQERVRE